MPDYVIALIAMLPSLVCILASVFLCLKEREGWGWFLFIGFITAASQDTIISLLKGG